MPPANDERAARSSGGPSVVLGDLATRGQLEMCTDFVPETLKTSSPIWNAFTLPPMNRTLKILAKSCPAFSPLCALPFTMTFTVLLPAPTETTRKW
jgi:hypothetical protein